MTPRDRLKELFRQRALQFGDFTLASGKKSTYYVNSKKVLFHAEAITLLGDLLYEATKDLDFQAIGGLEVGAIPMAAAALTAFHRNGRSLEGFFVRKQAKEHGSKERSRAGEGGRPGGGDRRRADDRRERGAGDQAVEAAGARSCAWCASATGSRAPARRWRGTTSARCSPSATSGSTPTPA